MQPGCRARCRLGSAGATAVSRGTRRSTATTAPRNSPAAFKAACSFAHGQTGEGPSRSHPLHTATAAQAAYPLASQSSTCQVQAGAPLGGPRPCRQTLSARTHLPCCTCATWNTDGNSLGCSRCGAHPRCPAPAGVPFPGCREAYHNIKRRTLRCCTLFLCMPTTRTCEKAALRVGDIDRGL